MVTSFASSLDIFIVAIFGVFDRLYWSRFADNGQTGRWHTDQGSALLPSSFRNGWVLSWRIFLFWFRNLLVSARKRRLMHVYLPLITPGGINQFLSNSLQRSYQCLQVRASSYFQLNQPTRCSNFSSLLLVV